MSALVQLAVYSALTDALLAGARRAEADSPQMNWFGTQLFQALKADP
jgi:hypothetical protein